jgi:hypothetical protein
MPRNRWWRRLPELSRCILRLEPDGFSRWQQQRRWWKWREPELLFRLRWDQIDPIIAYKDDVFVYDIICLGFFIDGDTERYLFVDEDMQDWSELTKQLDETFRVAINGTWISWSQRSNGEERTIWEKKKAPNLKRQLFQAPGAGRSGHRAVAWPGCG